MLSNIPDRKLQRYADLGVFGISFLVFAAIFALHVPTDIQVHIQRNSYPNPAPGFMTNFLYYWLVWLVSYLVPSQTFLGVFFSALLAFAVMWKYKLSRALIFEKLVLRDKNQTMARWMIISSIGLVFAFSLPVSLNLADYYLGQFSPNIWHNSTTIVVMPFVILAFYASYTYLLKPANGSFGLLILWTALIYIIKPSILPVLALVFPLLALSRYPLKRPFWMAALYSLLVILMLITPMLFVAGGSAGRNEGGGLAFGLFEVWSLYSDNYLVSLLATLLFPILCVVLYLKKAKEHLLLSYGWTTWLVAFLMFAFIHETGQFFKAGNFGWQLIMASYLLFLTSVIFFNKQLMKKGMIEKKDKAIMAAFLLHVVSGAVYLVKMMFLGYQ
ncbi:MAG: hypothetical protein HEP71_29430 [Roseivirga sp.]|nr:hypothetical protein [Roseivirga sp.]